jgi:hypothetical protein
MLQQRNDSIENCILRNTPLHTLYVDTKFPASPSARLCRTVFTIPSSRCGLHCAVGQLWYNSPIMRYDTVPPAMADFGNTTHNTIHNAIHRRQMSTTLLLLLASHRPLTFFTGQLLYALAPLAALVGLERIDAWAALLSAPDANARLTALLVTPQQP